MLSGRSQSTFVKFSQSGLCWLWVTGFVVVFDQISKFFARKYLVFSSPIVVMPHFNFTLTFNKGAAFNFLSHQLGWQIVFLNAISVIVGLAIIIWLRYLPYRNRWMGIALCLVLGGAWGNLIDRVCQGQVTDFIQWYAGNFYWPTFNLADSAICLGAVMLLIKSKSHVA